MTREYRCLFANRLREGVRAMAATRNDQERQPS
jgi:hypothetical protein